MKKVIILIRQLWLGKDRDCSKHGSNGCFRRKTDRSLILTVSMTISVCQTCQTSGGEQYRSCLPDFVGAGITQTNMPAAVGSAFAKDWDLVIFDVGGDPAGALSLARYHSDFAELEPGQLEVYDIINVRRPMSETPEKILKLKEDMEGFARQMVTGFINNSNLQAWASAADLREGYPIVKAASELAGIPVVHTTGRKEFLDEFLSDEGLDPDYIGVPIPLETYMHRSWDTFTDGGIYGGRGSLGRRIL